MSLETRIVELGRAVAHDVVALSEALSELQGSLPQAGCPWGKAAFAMAAASTVMSLATFVIVAVRL